MEFLIIAFIIISLISSISKNIKKQMKKDAPFDPWAFDSEPSQKEAEEPSAEAEAEEEIIEEEPEPAEDITVVLESLPEPETAFGEQLVEEEEFLSYEEMEEEAIKPLLPEKEKVYPEFPEAEKPEEELKTFLTGRKLPLAIIASEVLGPPRAKQPYHYLSSRMTTKHL